MRSVSTHEYSLEEARALKKYPVGVPENILMDCLERLVIDRCSWQVNVVPQDNWFLSILLTD